MWRPQPGFWGDFGVVFCKKRQKRCETAYRFSSSRFQVPFARHKMKMWRPWLQPFFQGSEPAFRKGRHKRHMAP
jgi:hypothetical protein